MIFWADLIFMLSMLVTAILILWILTNLMIKTKKISILLPFFFSSILLGLSAGFSFYGVFDQKVWFVLEFSWGILFFWIFIIIWGKNARTN